MQRVEVIVLHRCVLVLVVTLSGCGPVVDSATQEAVAAECPPADAEGLSHAARVRVRFVNDTSEALVVEDHYRSYWPRYFDVEGVADGRSIHGPADRCSPDPPSCEQLMIDNFVDCKGIALSGSPIFLPPATAYDVSWTVELLAVHELPPDCAWDGMAQACSVTIGATAGEYSVRARSLLASTCDTSDWACKDDEPPPDEACLLGDSILDRSCRDGPEASARWDGGSEIVLVFAGR